MPEGDQRGLHRPSESRSVQGHRPPRAAYVGRGRGGMRARRGVALTRARVRRARMALLALSGLLASCGDDVAGPTEPDEVTYAAATGVNLAQMTKLASGVYVQTLAQGTGTATITANSRIIVDYTGWLPNGTVFDGP